MMDNKEHLFSCKKKYAAMICQLPIQMPMDHSKQDETSTVRDARRAKDLIQLMLALLVSQFSLPLPFFDSVPGHVPPQVENPILWMVASKA